jgi:type II secretory pathway component GspD/PulD (secretin)
MTGPFFLNQVVEPMKKTVLVSGPVLLLFLGLAGCVTEARWPDTSALSEQATIFAGGEAVPMTSHPPRYTIDPPFGQDRVEPPKGEGERRYPIPDGSTGESYNPFKQYSAQTYYGDDGTITRHYYFMAGTGENIRKLLAAQIDKISLAPGTNGAELEKQPLHSVYNWPNFLTDTRPVKGGAGTTFNNYNFATGNAADLVVVKTDKETLREVDSYLSNLQNEIPMIEIQVRVAELALTDSLQYGLSSVIDKITDGDAFLTGWLTNFNTETMKVSAAGTFPGALLSIGGDHDKLALDAQLELLQRIADSETLAAPRITVLNGHRAVIVTGQQTPIVKPILSGSQLAYSYEYKPTGINLVIIPHLLPGGIIQIQVSAEVSAVTGEETVDLGGGPVGLPIISKRNLGTKLRVRDGTQFVLGGLYTYSDMEVISKIPILGDIPGLGFLFKSYSTSKEKKEIIFHIIPRVVRGQEGLIQRNKEGS